MSGDEVRRLARRVSAVADEMRVVCARTAAASGVHWQSIAAERFRSQLAQAAGRARLAADTVDRAATALCRHAAALDSIPRWLPGPVPVPIAGLAGPVLGVAARSLVQGDAMVGSVAAAVTPLGATLPGSGRAGALAGESAAMLGRVLR